ncbi:MAG: alanine:cation symporter family protein, partial [Arcanobacterium sp.]|nr:alanine:cation symporter family protein [Arcanobacterium sp.]
IIVCSATAFIILVGGIYKPGQELEGASLTTNSAVAVLGGWIEPILIFLILIFCFSTLIGNYAYAEVNMDYLFPRSKNANMALRWAVVIASFIGAVSKIAFVWVLADTAMFFMAVINLVAILLLGKWAFGVLKDYEGKAVDARFIAAGNKHMPGEYAESIWTAEK